MIFELVGADALIGFSSLINNYIKISIPYHTKNVNNFVDVNGFFEYNNSITAKEVTNMDRYKKYASDRKDDICDLLAKLVAIPSVMEEAKPGYPFGEAPAKALETMLAAAKALGFAVNNVDNYYGTADYLQFFVIWMLYPRARAGHMSLSPAPKRTAFSTAEA